MQEVSRVLWQRFGDFEPGTYFLAWARRIAYFRILEFRRGCDRRLQILPEDLLQTIADQAAAPESYEQERRDALLHCFDDLRPSDRTIINARYTSGVTIVDLAKHLGRPVNSVYKSLGRIRQTLLACIERRISSV
jgi:RNA polymerase sigma-70 factor (ECF subfamily)